MSTNEPTAPPKNAERRAGRRRALNYGGMTVSEYRARQDAWGQEMLAAFARQTPQEREMKRAAWRAFWDGLIWQADQCIAARQAAPGPTSPDERAGEEW